jgi:hypothetical protein
MKPPGLSFFILIVLSAASVYAALLLVSQYAPEQQSSFIAVSHINDGHKGADLSVADWKEFNDSESRLSFKHPSDWQVQRFDNRAGMDIITIKPATSPDKIRIYISPDNYFALDGLPARSGTVAGARAVNVNDVVVGVRSGGLYYTFDIGTDIKLQPEFKTLLETVAFK